MKGSEPESQAHSGLFQFLPLGLRVQDKIERLLEKHMSKIGLFWLLRVRTVVQLLSTIVGASKLSLSTFSSEELWKKSGRLDSSASEVLLM